jgi:hypothetical protein
MADETITQPTPVPAAPEVSPAQERITQLSDKVKTVSEEKDKALADASAAEKRATFAEGFADVLGTQPAAKDHKDEIKAKVLAGLSVEDATFAVLGKAGKLGNAPIAPIPTTPAGGSAATVPAQTGEKSIGDMTQAERRAEIAKTLDWS